MNSLFLFRTLFSTVSVDATLSEHAIIAINYVPEIRNKFKRFVVDNSI